MRTRKAFTLIELIVVIGVIGILIAISLPALAAARNASRRSLCAANLHAIGQSMQVYANQENTFPTNLPPKTAAKVGKWSNPPIPHATDISRDPIRDSYGDYSSPGEPMVNMWLLVLGGTLEPKQFICPEDPRFPVPAAVHVGLDTGATITMLNFGAIDNTFNPAITYSYSFAYPWISAQSVVAPWWKGTPDPMVPVGADIGPSMTPPFDDPTGPAGSAVSNSKNHQGKGQNVLFADEHVTFSVLNTVGKMNDNVYTGANDKIWVQTLGTRFNSIASLNVDPNDIVLVPAAP